MCYFVCVMYTHELSYVRVHFERQAGFGKTVSQTVIVHDRGHAPCVPSTDCQKTDSANGIM
jgi:hypothetical protein